MDQVFIKDLRARGVIGVYDWERETTQEILINLVLFTNLKTAGETDQLEHSIDYHALALKVQALAETAQRFTVEALAADIAQLCLQDSSVQKVCVRVEKPGAVPYCGSVGVEIERSR